MPLTRRRLIRLLPIAAFALPPLAGADDSRVQESDADAQAQNYVADAKRVDRKKFPSYAPGQTCGNCSQFDGSAKQPFGGCALFLGREVAAAGWCQAWEKAA